MKKKILEGSVPSVLLLSGMLMTGSGLLLQITYHMGLHGTNHTDPYPVGISYSGWSSIHKISIIIFTVFTAWHIVQNRKWYKHTWRKKRFRMNRRLLLLTALFFITALTGYLPWIIKLGEGNEILRKRFVEIHDKLALLFFVYFVIHMMRKYKCIFSGLRIGNPSSTNRETNNI